MQYSKTEIYWETADKSPPIGKWSLTIVCFKQMQRKSWTSHKPFYSTSPWAETTEKTSTFFLMYRKWSDKGVFGAVYSQSSSSGGLKIVKCDGPGNTSGFVLCAKMGTKVVKITWKKHEQGTAVWVFILWDQNQMPLTVTWRFSYILSGVHMSEQKYVFQYSESEHYLEDFLQMLS